MDDPSDPLFGSGLQREDVVCAMCGAAWDERVVAGPRDGEDDLSLCPVCLLTTSHGAAFPDDPVATDTTSELSASARGGTAEGDGSR